MRRPIKLRIRPMPRSAHHPLHQILYPRSQRQCQIIDRVLGYASDFVVRRDAAHGRAEDVRGEGVRWRRGFARAVFVGAVLVAVGVRVQGGG